ncbi:MAG TPA: HAD family hydrolase [Methanothermococcus okinawensis]|uniref:HAD family hydrolase n=1 Tax=Methanothermococcus okinawensis TaxID=155863 RepID=A0A832YT00_9EURY|nr:HAD family hydrolase [Methanothermococcus okinawensis]
MKTAVVFDCSGTLVNVKRIIKEIKSQRFLCDHQTVDIVGINERYIIPEAHQNLKRDLVRRLKREGYRVIMVGDGSNDVPAMLESDLSIINLQGGSVSKKALDNADIKIENIKEILDVLDYRKCIL